MAKCFVVMPFKPELRYLYLFLKQHIESTFPGTSCDRGDARSGGRCGEAGTEGEQGTARPAVR